MVRGPNSIVKGNPTFLARWLDDQRGKKDRLIARIVWPIVVVRPGIPELQTCLTAWRNEPLSPLRQFDAAKGSTSKVPPSPWFDRPKIDAIRGEF